MKVASRFFFHFKIDVSVNFAAGLGKPKKDGPPLLGGAPAHFPFGPLVAASQGLTSLLSGRKVTQRPSSRP